MKHTNTQPNICTFLTECSDAWQNCVRVCGEYMLEMKQQCERPFLFVWFFLFVSYHQPMFKFLIVLHFEEGCPRGASVSQAQPILGWGLEQEASATPYVCAQQTPPFSTVCGFFFLPFLAIIFFFSYF